MTEAEVNALEEITNADIPLKPGAGGFFTRLRNLLSTLDPVAANYTRSQAELKHLVPSEIIGDWVREKIAAEA